MVNEQGRFTGLCSQCREGTTGTGRDRPALHEKLHANPRWARGLERVAVINYEHKFIPESVSAPLQAQSFSADWPVKVGLNPSPPSLPLAIRI